MGYLWALCSVLLVSSAQLAMKWAMMQFPPVSFDLGFLSAVVFDNWPGLLALFSGLSGYALSMVCWYLALGKIPLSKAYPLLSLSYVLVWAAAIALPWLNEPFSRLKLIGVGIIFIGLLLIFLPGHSATLKKHPSSSDH